MPAPAPEAAGRSGSALDDSTLLPRLRREEVFRALESRPAGLTHSEAGQRQARFGPNVIDEVRGHHLLKQVARQFIHLFALLLWAGSALAVLVGQTNLAAAIVAVIMINGAFGLWQEHRAEATVAALKKLLPDAATVIREGSEVRLAAAQLVPGDLVLLAEGDRLSADARLVQALDLRLDESTLTGESHPVYKTDLPVPDTNEPLLQAHNMVFAGTIVVAGSGQAVVASTGMRREFGRIAQLTATVHQGPSPLELEAGSVARRVALLSVAMGGLFFAIGHLFAGLSFVDGAIFAIGIVLGNVPEGLLPTMTLSLAMGVQRMARRNAIVKRLAAVETLGSCSVICTDKTGTLTKNQLTVCEAWIPSGEEAAFSGSGYDLAGRIERNGRALDLTSRIPFLPVLRIGALCNTARLYRGTNGCQVAGDPTEAALLVAAEKADIEREAELRLRPLVRQLAFDSARKRMSTIHRALSTEGSLVAYVKGAPVELLQHCSRALVGERELDLTEELIGRVKAANDNMAARGMRVLAMAYRYLPPEDEALLSDLAPGEVEQNMVFAGLTGMVDAPRDEVAPAVTTCRAAGIRVVMITGDYGVTAEAIARQVGILPAGVPAMVVDGAHLEAMNDAELEDVLGTSQPIFARATPEHKLRVVEALQRMGHVVAVTGDGVNDAPALKKADIGVAMGIMGTDVAREAAEMVRGYGFLGLMTTAVVLTAFMLFLTSHAWAWGQRAPLSASVAAGATTITFLGIVVMQVGNAFACRAERTSAFTLGLLSNRLLLWGIGFELAFAAALIYVPFLQPVFGTAAVSPLWWPALLACVVPVFLMEEGRKWIARRRADAARSAT